MAIFKGEIPTINFFNNFGVPLLGDGLTYPFAIQSLTYYFFDNHIAMSINRFLIATLTFIFGFLFCRIYLNQFSSLICSILITFNPVSFWYPVHQYQMATPLFLISFYLLNKFYNNPSKKLLWYNFFLFCIMVLSVSINHIVLIIPFIITWCFFRNKCLLNINFFLPIISFFSAILFSFPQTLDFFKSFFQSVRVQQGVYDNILNDFYELLIGIMIPPSEWIAYDYGAQLQITTYFSIPIIASILIGILLIRKKILWKQTTIFFAGIIPTTIALFLYVTPEIRLQMPLIKSVDITRVFWFSYPFSIIYTGYFISSIWLSKAKKKPILLCMLILLSALIFLIYTPETSNINYFFYFIIFLMLLGLFIFYFFNNKHFYSNYLLINFSKFFIIFSIIISISPTIIKVLGLNSGYCGGTQYSANKALASFDPKAFIPYINKNSRVASEIPTYLGYDLRLAPFDILGSNARAIVVDKKLGKYLEKKNVVKIDQVPYGYFFSRPWDNISLSKLGIRYLIVNSESAEILRQKGWKHLFTTQNKYLLEHPNKPSIIYNLKKNNLNYIHDFIIEPNKILVNLSENNQNSKLVFTFIKRQGYFAYIDGIATNINEEEGGFMSINLKPNDKSVILWHKGFSFIEVLIYMFGSILICFIFSRPLK